MDTRGIRPSKSKDLHAEKTLNSILRMSCDLNETRLQARRALENSEVIERPRSWLHHKVPASQSSRDCRFFDSNGFLHLPGFCSETECAEMKEFMAQLVNEWDPAQTDSFGTDDGSNVKRGDYFLDSANRIHHFCEPAAMENGKMKPEYNERKLEALNKSGHGLHLDPALKIGGSERPNPFFAYCHGTKIQELVKGLGWTDPVVPQSMYIYKQARHGGVVSSHQDSTFLHTTPRQSCLGLWLALDDATLENGCLWVRPKSHLESVRRQYCRNEEHFGPVSIARRSNEVEGDAQAPTFTMKNLRDGEEAPWDGSLPGDGSMNGLLEAGFIPVECKAGDLLVFCGELDHLSLPNHSDKARHTFQLHLVEGPGAGIVWSETNWLQYPDHEPFVPLE